MGTALIDPLGPLARLVGDGAEATWVGEGFNATWRPHPLAEGGQDRFLELNLPTGRLKVHKSRLVVLLARVNRIDEISEQGGVMSTVVTRLGRVRGAPRLVAVLAVLMLASLAYAGSANAEISGELNGHLPGKTWTTKGEFGFYLYQWAEKTSGSGPVCITAAEYSGGWSFPYGWQCNHPGPNPWVFGGEGYPAVDNPNSNEIGFHMGWN